MFDRQRFAVGLGFASISTPPSIGLSTQSFSASAHDKSSYADRNASMKTSSGRGFDGMLHIIAPKRRFGIDPLWSRSVYRPPEPQSTARSGIRATQRRRSLRVGCTSPLYGSPTIHSEPARPHPRLARDPAEWRRCGIPMISRPFSPDYETRFPSCRCLPTILARYEPPDQEAAEPVLRYTLSLRGLTRRGGRDRCKRTLAMELTTLQTSPPRTR
jgi:hypothetical protein